MESSCLDRPTRFEVVSSVISVDIITCNRCYEFPPLPEQSFGNISSAAVFNLPIEYNGISKKINYNSLAGELR
ncbi:hypothetical protein AB3S75_029894 [Citrus x aurantiifolia]